MGFGLSATKKELPAGSSFYYSATGGQRRPPLHLLQQIIKFLR
jgi:hypothetical protein